MQQPIDWDPIYKALYDYTHEFLLAAVDEGVAQAGIKPLTDEARKEVTRPMLVQLAHALIVRNNQNLQACKLKVDAAGRYTIEIPDEQN